MLKRYMHNRERYFAMLNDDRVVQPFGWGVEFISDHVNGDDPRKILSNFSERVIATSDEYFAAPENIDFRLEKRIFASSGAMNAGKPKKPGAQVELPVLSWISAVETPSVENNTALATYFPHETKRAAVVILPHWNAGAGTYFDLAKHFNKIGLSALRLTLPYHEERMPLGLTRADHLVTPNVGRALQSITQAVSDSLACVTWLKQQGYEKIGIVGTSIGSCVGFLSFVHDMRIDAAVFNHVSGYMADVVWRGLSTYHVRESFGENLTLDELREYWLPVSPMAYIDKLATQPRRPQRYIYAKYDLTFPVDLSLGIMKVLREKGIPHSEVTLPCGHYTLGEKPWIYIDGYKIIRFLRQHLK
jgi:hypothetical protein